MTAFGFDKALLALLEGDTVTRRRWPLDTWGNAPVLMLLPECRQLTDHLGDFTLARQFALLTQVSTDDFYQRVWIPTHEDLLARDWERVTMADKPAPKPDPSRTDSKPGNPRRTDTDIPDPGGDRKS